MIPPKAGPGWDTGYFRIVGEEGNPLVQRFYNIKTHEFQDRPYDSEEEDWFPLYVFMGRKP